MRHPRYRVLSGSELRDARTKPFVNDLHGTEFEWIGSAYALASTAFLPLSGGLAQVS